MKFNCKNKIAGAFVAGALASTALTGSAIAGDGSAWLEQAERLVDKHMTYPRMALIKGQGGRALVDVEIDANGSITSFALTQTTGSDILDRAAKKTVQEIGSFPAPEFAGKDGARVRVSLNYLFARTPQEEMRMRRKVSKSGSVRAQQIAAKGGAPVLASVEFLDN